MRARIFILLIACTGFAFAADAPSSPGQDVIEYLNRTILWYRQLVTQQQLAKDPSDILYFNDNRQLADQVVRLSFDFARARAQMLAAQPSPAPAEGQTQSNSTPYQALAGRVAKTEQEIKDTQRELESQRTQLQSATTARRRQALEANVSETQSELDLLQARRDAMRGILDFVSGTAAAGGGSGNLMSQIEELARTVPAASASASTTSEKPAGQSTAVVAAASSPRAAPSGLLGLTSDLFDLRRKLRTLSDGSELTDQLLQSGKQLRAPLVATMRQLTQAGDQLSSQPESQDPKVLGEQKKALDAMTAQFKQLSASVLPLAKQSILLELYKRSIGNWRNAVQQQYNQEFKSLILRLAILGFVLAIIIAMSEVWRRATFRYVQDARRRYQFLLLRRIVVWFLVAIIIAVAFASELGSLATFAGLMTAGVAVALQNVILSIAGYFFLIGKYGVRVGDRVQIAGVTGEVLDIGLVRIHLMEIGSVSEANPTGRVVVFSNAVVFQANAGLFKQIPGTRFGWHEITLTVASDSNYHEVEHRVLNAVNKVFQDYRDGMEKQRQTMERNLGPVPAHDLRPQSRLRLTPGGLEVVIRYPVDLDKAAEIDDRVTRELLDATKREPQLQVLGPGTAVVQTVGAK